MVLTHLRRCLRWLSMARTLRVEYPGALYHVMSRGDRREAIFRDEAWIATGSCPRWAKPAPRPAGRCLRSA